MYGNAEKARINNFPKSGRGLGHVTPTIFGSTVGYSSDSLASCNLFMRLKHYSVTVGLLRTRHKSRTEPNFLCLVLSVFDSVFLVFRIAMLVSVSVLLISDIGSVFRYIEQSDYSAYGIAFYSFIACHRPYHR